MGDIGRNQKTYEVLSTLPESMNAEQPKDAPQRQGTAPQGTEKTPAPQQDREAATR